MNVQTLVLLGLCAAFVVLNVLDVLSTNAFLANRTAKEANPVNAWAQRTLGGWWWVVKLPLLLTLVVAWHFRATVEMRLALGALDACYLVTVMGNYRIARNP